MHITVEIRFYQPQNIWAIAEYHIKTVEKKMELPEKYAINEKPTILESSSIKVEVEKRIIFLDIVGSYTNLNFPANFQFSVKKGR